MEKKDLFKAFGNVKNIVGEAAKGTVEVSKKAGNALVSASGKAVDLASEGKKKLIATIDQDGDGEIEIEDIIILGMKTPGVKVDRDAFLRKELYTRYKDEVVEEAVHSTPANAGIAPEDIDKIADEVIQYERNIVSGISAALGAPGGAAMLATMPADMAQYYGTMLRAAQKLLYLYGFPQMVVKENSDVPLDSETINMLTICLGVMFGVVGANNALKAVAKALAIGVEKKLINAALTKGAIYPMVKKIAKWFAVNMTKKMFASFFRGAIPVIGGVIGGGLTYFSFKPCCDRLKDGLKNTRLANPEQQDDPDIIDIVPTFVNETDSE